METQQILEQSNFENGILKLPQVQLDRKQYMAFAKDMEFLGGKWKGGKTQGFVFDKLNSVNEILQLMDNGENKKNLQFFPTPNEIAKYLVGLVKIGENDTILEPSAGRGAIIKAIQENSDYRSPIFYYEISEVNQKYLKDLSDIVKLGDDFLKADPEIMKFDIIIANPPFSKNQDIAHIMKMYDLLNDGGVLVSIASKHWEAAKEKKCQEFREFLHYKNAQILALETGKFKESGTMISSKIIIISKMPF